MIEELLAAARVELPRPALLTGGTGRLGTELRALLPELLAPTSSELDVLNPDEFVKQVRPALVVHAAAWTDVAAAETDRAGCWRLNVQGARRMALAARDAGARFVLISTDYVFDGERGNYLEDDVPGPVLNHYALTKLLAEEVARSIIPAEQLLIIRTSFRAREWPHPRAFQDLFTTQDYIDVLAPHIALAVCRLERIPYDTLHIAGKRRSSFELARERAPHVEPAFRAEATVKLPADVSLNTERWQGLLADWRSLDSGGRNAS